jgi:hypothetical protein
LIIPATLLTPQLGTPATARLAPAPLYRADGPAAAVLRPAPRQPKVLRWGRPRVGRPHRFEAAYRLICSPALAEITGDGRRWTVSMISVDPLEIDAGDAEVRVPELPLDDHEWDAFVRHLDRVRVP